MQRQASDLLVLLPFVHQNNLCPDIFFLATEEISAKVVLADSRINRFILLRSAASGTLFLGTENPIVIFLSFASVKRNPVSNVP